MNPHNKPNEQANLWLREMMAEKGFTNAEVTHTVTPIAGGPKLVNVTFNVTEGPKVKIRDVDFVGTGRGRADSAIDDAAVELRFVGIADRAAAIFEPFLHGGQALDRAACPFILPEKLDQAFKRARQLLLQLAYL